MNPLPPPPPHQPTPPTPTPTPPPPTPPPTPPPPQPPIPDPTLHPIQHLCKPNIGPHASSQVKPQLRGLSLWCSGQASIGKDPQTTAALGAAQAVLQAASEVASADQALGVPPPPKLISSGSTDSNDSSCTNALTQIHSTQAAAASAAASPDEASPGAAASPGIAVSPAETSGQDPTAAAASKKGSDQQRAATDKFMLPVHSCDAMGAFRTGLHAAVGAPLRDAVTTGTKAPHTAGQTSGTVWTYIEQCLTAGKYMMLNAFW